MNILEIIAKKRDGQKLSEAEITFFINEYTKTQTVKDYQAAALLMAIYIHGLDDKETYYLTKAMLASGNTIDLSSIPGVKIDKHSTGGVGDKVSLILSPIMMSLGYKIAKLSGKGLGHTGGTIDKLESIGVQTSLTSSQYMKLLKKIGIFIVAQTEDIVPADKKLYALRNATSTVGSRPLIAASIVSKKLALKTDYVFLDVKVGDGGFCPTVADATALAEIMLKLFKAFNRKAIIHITDMTQPLGRAIGNAIEIKETIEFLNNENVSEELKEIIYCFASSILLTTKQAKAIKQAYKMIDDVLASKTALNNFYL